MSSKLEKTIARQQAKVAEGQFYEAHQQLRVIASRYVKSSDWTSAIDLLSQGATMLLRANQGGSGGDLCLFLMDVYNKSGVDGRDVQHKARLIYLLRQFPKGEPTRKRFVGEVVSWSSRTSGWPAGDPEIHHVAGTLFAEEGEVLDAERHFTLGTSDSPASFAALEYKWYKSDDPSTAPHYLARVILPYLLVGNVRAANKAHLLFNRNLASTSGLNPQDVSSSTSELRVYPSLPLMNFLGLLLLSVQRGTADLFRALRAQYNASIKDAVGTAWDEALTQIGETYFGIKIPSQSNPLMDMMGSFLMGGGSGGGSQSGVGGRRGIGAAPAPAPGLD